MILLIREKKKKKKKKKRKNKTQTHCRICCYISPDSSGFTLTDTLTSSLVPEDQNNRQDADETTAPPGCSDSLHRYSAWYKTFFCLFIYLFWIKLKVHLLAFSELSPASYSLSLPAEFAQFRQPQSSRKKRLTGPWTMFVFLSQFTLLCRVFQGVKLCCPSKALRRQTTTDWDFNQF